MAEPHPGVDLDQLRDLGRSGGVQPDAEVLGGASEHGDVTHRFGSRGQQKKLRVHREREQAPQEALLDLGGQQRVSGRSNPPARSARVRPRGSSSSASGLPRVSATMRSSMRASRRPG
jgi:hypothetical protein